eukprot:1185122-Prorocentrum_minimum.AAC.2
MSSLRRATACSDSRSDASAAAARAAVAASRASPARHLSPSCETARTLRRGNDSRSNRRVLREVIGGLVLPLGVRCGAGYPGNNGRNNRRVSREVIGGLILPLGVRCGAGYPGNNG